jgi:mono/diheme cytochrome c family protein
VPIDSSLSKSARAARAPVQPAWAIDRIPALVSRARLIPAGGGFAALAATLVLVPALSGCGVSAKGDFDRGKQLFAAKCATCHALRDAASSGNIGPNLDYAFAQARASGMDPETIAGVVKNQVENPRPSTNNPSVSMPPDLLSGQDLDDVASYIGTVAGNPKFQGPQIPNDPGARVFISASPTSCSSCHTLESVGSTATTGPNLDDAIPKLKTAAAVKTAIVNPDKTIAQGYPKGVMPSTFGQTIPSSQLDQLVKFLLKCAGNASDPACQPAGSSSSSSSSSSGSSGSGSGSASSGSGSTSSKKSGKSG